MGKDKGIMPASHGAAASPGAGYRAGEAGQSGGRLALWAPNASCPPQLLQRAKKTEAKLGSSCSSIKQFRVGFPPSFGGGGQLALPGTPVCLRAPLPHTPLFTKSGRFPEEHSVRFRVGQPHPSPQEQAPTKTQQLPVWGAASHGRGCRFK